MTTGSPAPRIALHMFSHQTESRHTSHCVLSADDCFTIYMSRAVRSKPLQVFSVALSEEACQRKCLDIQHCKGTHPAPPEAPGILLTLTPCGCGKHTRQKEGPPSPCPICPKNWRRITLDRGGSFLASHDHTPQTQTVATSRCVSPAGFQYNRSAAQCALYDNATLSDERAPCCDVWIKRTCKGSCLLHCVAERRHAQRLCSQRRVLFSSVHSDTWSPKTRAGQKRLFN